MLMLVGTRTLLTSTNSYITTDYITTAPPLVVL